MRLKIIIALWIIATSSIGYAQMKTTTKSSLNSTHLKVGEQATLHEIKITFQKVVSDGRCPEGVNCVWAGICIVELKLELDGKTKSVFVANTGGQPAFIPDGEDPEKGMNFKIGAYPIKNMNLALTSITPIRTIKRDIAPNEYSIALELK